MGAFSYSVGGQVFPNASDVQVSGLPKVQGGHCDHPSAVPRAGAQEHLADTNLRKRAEYGFGEHSLFCVTSWGLFRQFQAILGNFQAISGNLLGPFSGDFRQFRAIFGNFGRFRAIFSDFGPPKPKKKPVLINKKKAGDCTPKIRFRRAQLGGRFGYFLFSFCSGRGKGESEAPGGRGGGGWWIGF